MSYKYDVFLSYRRDCTCQTWVDEIFYPLFQSYLSEALGYEASIFKDTEAIRTGSAWQSQLKNALAYSKVLVPIFIPSYFWHEYCVREFSVLDYRQKQLGYLTNIKPEGLIVPIRLFDGEHFPDYVTGIQMLQATEYNIIGDGMKKTELYVRLQYILQKWIYDVCTAIIKSPVWNPDWINDEWSEDPFKLYPLLVNSNNLIAPKL